MNNAELKAEADLMLRRCGLPELLAGYSGWFLGGSYGYDLMCWRDLDIYILDPDHDLHSCFEVAYELTRRLAATKSFFTNNLGSQPNGLYWGIRLGDARQGAWKIDLWFLDETGYEQHGVYSARMREHLTPETRSAILSIKQAYWQRPEYRDTVTSDLIYRAVFENGVREIGEFETFLKEPRP